MKSISAFAEELILGSVENIKSGKPPAITESNKPDNVPDLSDIKIPEEFLNQVLSEEKNGKSASIKKVLKPSKSPESLIQELQELIVKAKFIIQEMTTTGMLGGGCSTKSKDKKADKYKKFLKKYKGKK